MIDEVRCGLAMGLPFQDGHAPRALQENATTNRVLQAVQTALASAFSRTSVAPPADRPPGSSGGGRVGHDGDRLINVPTGTFAVRQSSRRG